MGKSSLVERSRLAAQRSAGAVSVETSRAWHRENLERDLGRPEGGWAPTDGWGTHEQASMITLLVRPITLFFLSILMFLAVLGVMLWRDGMFDTMILSFTQKSAAPTSDWVLGDRLSSTPLTQNKVGQNKVGQNKHEQNETASPSWPDPYEGDAPPPPPIAKPKSLDGGDAKGDLKSAQ